MLAERRGRVESHCGTPLSIHSLSKNRGGSRLPLLWGKVVPGVIHPTWKHYSLNPVLAVPCSPDSSGTQTLNSRLHGQEGMNPIPLAWGLFVLENVMDMSEILSLISPRARGGVWKDVWVSQDDALGCRGISWH